MWLGLAKKSTLVKFRERLWFSLEVRSLAVQNGDVLQDKGKLDIVHQTGQSVRSVIIRLYPSSSCDDAEAREAIGDFNKKQHSLHVEEVGVNGWETKHFNLNQCFPSTNAYFMMFGTKSTLAAIYKIGQSVKTLFI